MSNEYRYETFAHALPDLLGTLLAEGEDVLSRNGNTKELRFPHISVVNPLNRYAQATARKASLAAQIAETMWVLAGRDDIEFLSQYLPRAKDFSDDGKVWRGAYGPRIRSWNGGTDQLVGVINILRESRNSRRAVISLFDAEIDQQPGKDIPCNNWLHFLPRGDTLDLHVVARSNDVMWGWSGINFFEWSTMLEIVASYAGFVVGEMHFSVSSFHLYEHHFDKAKAIIGCSVRNQTFDAPRFKDRSDVNLVARDLSTLLSEWFHLEKFIREFDYQRRPTNEINFRVLSDRISKFPDPMLRSWLLVLVGYWSDNREHSSLTLHRALAASPKRPVPSDLKKFQDTVSSLHKQKHEAYGDSWKKRGEQVSIWANIARKVDRLVSKGETTDENQIDTAVDLWVYVLKYRLWLSEQDKGVDLPEGVGVWSPQMTDFHDPIEKMVRSFRPRAMGKVDERAFHEDIYATFENLMKYDQHQTKRELRRVTYVDHLLQISGDHAFALWLGHEKWREGNEKRAWKGYGDGSDQ